MYYITYYNPMTNKSILVLKTIKSLADSISVMRGFGYIVYYIKKTNAKTAPPFDLRSFNGEPKY